MSQLCCACCAFLVAASPPDVQPLKKAHSHNDYHHRRPLLDALSLGFCSVEADVFVVGNRLLVAHDRVNVKPDRTLRRLYLEPLSQRVAANGGHVHGRPATFTLLIDFKSEAQSTYEALHRVLADYQHMLVRHVNGRRIDGAVQVIISGNRPVEQVRSARLRLAAIDGRLANLGDAANDWMPLISDRWTAHFQWRGEGAMSNHERQKLRDMVAQAHRNGRRLRLWATPDRPEAWQELAAANVDLINTDDLSGLAKFLRQANP